MTQTLVIVVLFVAAMAALPWMVRRVQARQAAGGATGSVSSRVIGAVAVGPQQRVVTVEVGPEGARTWLVLGVTAQSIQCLHVLNSSAATSGSAVVSFAGEMARAAQDTDKASHA
ncbi:flagellar biosynthesis protein FliO [Acidovorax delafieldii 2AN]|uniref:Flagellar biosynthesis protein FliO n=1 Tax=Acidovorax delafieldii 2AN TaxID=573060 RepID=C5T1Z7_ACIDE|nr:flagellar biosynthetic protein FliO [Acidovorax delafieldii]EER61487.1 flagellar biosynthesis protein FliO [Acidovorax delafieldii 2AN]